MIGSRSFVRWLSRVRNPCDSSTTTTWNFRSSTAFATPDDSVKSDCVTMQNLMPLRHTASLSLRPLATLISLGASVGSHFSSSCAHV